MKYIFSNICNVYEKYHNDETIIRGNCNESSDDSYSSDTDNTCSSDTDNTCSSDSDNICSNFTKKYETKNEIFIKNMKLFSKKCIVVNSKNIIIWTTLKKIFIKWLNENVECKNIPHSKDIKKYFEKKIFKMDEKTIRYGNITARGWKGWKLIEY